MSNKKQIDLLLEVHEIIDSMQGIDDIIMHKIGVSPEELESPTNETLKKFKDYQKNLNLSKNNSMGKNV